MRADASHQHLGALLGRLAVEAQRRGPAPGPIAPGWPAVEAGGDVLLDLELDGSRYVLVRCPVAAARPVLSPREREIARMVAKGFPNKAIASVLDISTWTVSSHLRRIFLKLDVSSRAAMVARLAETGALSSYSDT